MRAFPKGRVVNATGGGTVSPRLDASYVSVSGTLPRILVYVDATRQGQKQWRYACKRLGLLAVDAQTFDADTDADKFMPTANSVPRRVFDVTGDATCLEELTRPYQWPCVLHWEFLLSVSVPRGGTGQGTTEDRDAARRKAAAQKRRDADVCCTFKEGTAAELKEWKERTQRDADAAYPGACL